MHNPVFFALVSIFPFNFDVESTETVEKKEEQDEE